MRVLLATDGSENSREALRQASQILSSQRDDLLILYSAPGYEMATLADPAAADRARQSLTDDVFARARSTLPNWSDRVETVKAQGDPRCEILTAAESQAA